MRLKQFVTAAVCGAILVTGSNFTGINSYAEEVEVIETGEVEIAETEEVKVVETEAVELETDDAEVVETEDSQNVNEIIEDEDSLLGAYSSNFFNGIEDSGYGFACASGYQLINKKEVFNGHVGYVYSYPYDDNGNILAEVMSQLDEEGNLDFIAHAYSYGYDAEGRLIKEISFGPMGGSIVENDYGLLTSSITTYEYDSKGNLVKIEDLNCVVGGEPYIYIFQYDSNNKLIKQEVYEYEELASYTTFEYNSNGKLASKSEYNNSSGVMMNKYTYKYDSNGNMIEKAQYDSNNNLEKIEKYDSHENLCEETNYRLSSKKEYKNEYDANGNLIKQTENDSHYYTYEYKYIGESTNPSVDNPTTPEEPATPTTTYVSMYRLYNPNSGEHFYTANEKEKNNLVSVGWRYEGIAWNAPKTSNIPVYRLYNPNAGDHHYTTSAAEKDNLVKVGWKYEGIGWYSTAKDGKPLYRLYNPNAKAGAHHYTTSAAERDNLKKLGWRDEGIAWYGGK